MESVPPSLANLNLSHWWAKMQNRHPLLFHIIRQHKTLQTVTSVSSINLSLLLVLHQVILNMFLSFNHNVTVQYMDSSLSDWFIFQWPSPLNYFSQMQSFFTKKERRKKVFIIFTYVHTSFTPFHGNHLCDHLHGHCRILVWNHHLVRMIYLCHLDHLFAALCLMA